MLNWQIHVTDQASPLFPYLLLNQMPALAWEKCIYALWMASSWDACKLNIALTREDCARQTAGTLSTHPCEHKSPFSHGKCWKSHLWSPRKPDRSRKTLYCSLVTALHWQRDDLGDWRALSFSGPLWSSRREQSLGPLSIREELGILSPLTATCNNISIEADTTQTQHTVHSLWLTEQVQKTCSVVQNIK